MIELSGLSFSYRSHPVFRDLSLSLEGGGIYGLLGENGAGKTTLMKIILGLLRGGGRCTVNGADPSRRSPGFLRDVFFLPEDTPVSDLPVEKLAAAFGDFYPGYDPDAFRRYVLELGVPGGKPLSRMSCGERKKAAVCTALSLNAGLLLMDEPTNGLDIPSKVKFRSILNEYRSRRGKSATVIISTHQVRDIDDVVDSVVILSGGQVQIHDLSRSGAAGERIDLEALFTAAAGYGPVPRRSGPDPASTDQKL